MSDNAAPGAAAPERDFDDLIRARPAGAGPPMVTFSNVTKTYHIQQRAAPRLGSWVLSKLFEHLRREPFNALEGVSFTVRRGEMVGFVGANGAGKSTILKLAAGISQPTSGTVAVHGRVTSMLELGVGFHPELSGLENIFYNGAIMGMSRDRIAAQLDAIIDFSGLRRFIFEPVKHYSSGMYARLAVSVAMHLDPEVILVDEILVVGDAEFQQRGMMRILELHERGVTTVLVTHEVTTARDLCDRLLWIEHGRLRQEGDPRAVARDYMRHMAAFSILPRHFLSPSQIILARATAAELAEHEVTSPPGRHPRIAGARAVSPTGAPLESLVTGDPLRLVFEIDDEGGTQPYCLAICALWPDGRVLFEDRSPAIAAPRNGTPVAYDIPACPLFKADIAIAAALLSMDDPPLVFDRLPEAIRFRMLTDVPFGDCAVVPPARWTVVEQA